jgi:hypothetical protein
MHSTMPAQLRFDPASGLLEPDVSDSHVATCDEQVFDSAVMRHALHALDVASAQTGPASTAESGVVAVSGAVSATAES